MRSARLVDHIWKTYVAYRELLFMTYGVYMSCHRVKTAESVLLSSLKKSTMVAIDQTGIHWLYDLEKSKTKF